MNAFRTFALVLLLVLVPVLAAAQADCVIGNTDPVVSWQAGWVGMGDGLAQFAPLAQSNCDCEVGFRVLEMTGYFVLSGPTQVTVQAELVAATLGGCPAPGSTAAVSAPVTLDLAEGLQAVTVPCNFDCTIVDEDFFLVLRLTAADGPVELPFTGSDTGIPKALPGDPCTSYRDEGTGWTDLVTAGFGGGLPIMATAECCGEPIGSAGPSWGRLKQEYR